MHYMNRIIAVAFLTACVALAVTAGQASQAAGEEKFREHCAACHAEGGNIIKPDKTLSRADRERNGVKTATDIVKLMRNPGEGMDTFDGNTVPDKEAMEIAEYILKNFK
jgi:cytochrome c6